MVLNSICFAWHNGFRRNRNELGGYELFYGDLCDVITNLPIVKKQFGIVTELSGSNICPNVIAITRMCRKKYKTSG